MKWWTVKVQSDAGEPSVQYRTEAETWEQALADVSALFQPDELPGELRAEFERGDYDIVVSPGCEVPGE